MRASVRAITRRELVTSQSARLLCAYVYADAGEGESTTDLVFSGHNLIAENGALLGGEPAGLKPASLLLPKSTCPAWSLTGDA